MERREFLKTCVAGMTIGTTSLPLMETARADNELVKRDIDPAKFAETAYQHFIPGKLTCSESILMAGCEALDIKSDLVPEQVPYRAGSLRTRVREPCGAAGPA